MWSAQIKTNIIILVPSKEKIVKGCLAELTKVGYWLENEDHSDYLLKLLEDILKYPDIVIDNRKAGTLQVTL